MRCPNCNSDQNETHFYCNNCGHDLHHTENHIQDYEIMSKTDSAGLVEQAVEDFKKQAHTVELETLEKIQDHAAKWAKTNLFFLGLATSVLVIALSLFGYNKITDLENLITESKKEVADKVVEAKQTSEKANREAAASLQEAQDLKKEIENIDLSSIREKLGKLSALEVQLENSIRNTNEISLQLKTERENVEKLQRSFFSISVHLDGNQVQDSSRLDSLVRKLNDQGFQFNRANISGFGVDHTEVIYYNRIARQQAKLIATLVQDSLSLPNKVPSRPIYMLERNPREILIKLKLP